MPILSRIVALGAITLAATLSAPAHAADTAPTTCAYTLSDFNGDGHADVAAGEPYRTVGTSAGAGAVRVVYGTGVGLATHGNQILDETSFGGTATASDHFGISAVAGYFAGHDCYADLAVGAPGADGGVGTVTVFRGSANGLLTGGTKQFTTTDVDAGATGKQKFGWSLAAGDFNGDGTDDLAVGANARGGFAGAVYLLYSGGGTGLSATGSTMLTEDTPGIPGTATKGDEFGYALAAGDFNGDGTEDLAIGAPNQELAHAKQSGMVVTLPGSDAGLVATSARYWREGLNGLAGLPETNDHFGASLATGSITGNAWDDLAVGTPGESIGAATQAGSVQVIRGSATGLTGTGNQIWTQHNPAVPGGEETGDQFGFSVAMGDFDGDGHADLAIGAPYEDLGTAVDAGNVTVLYGTGGGLGTARVQTWSQDSTGIAGGAEKKDDLAYSLQALPIRSAGIDDLVVGDPGEDSSGYVNDGMIAVVLGSSGGLTAAGNEAIGPDLLDGGAQNFAKMGARVG